MVIGIIVLHAPPFEPLGEIPQTPLGYIKAFFSHAVFRATVPMLTVISGFLVFQSDLSGKFKKLIKKKFFSIFIPMIIWNTPFALLIFFSQKYFIIEHEFSETLYPVSFLSWINAITGFLGNPANYPLNFLRDLFAVFFFTPLFRLLLKFSSWAGLFIVLSIYYWNLDGILVLRNSMLVSFYLGGMASYCGWNLKLLDRFSILFLFFLIIICMLIVLFKIENIQWFRLVSPILIWPATSLIHGNPVGHLLYCYSGNSFFTFLSHGPLLFLLWVGFQKLPDAIPYFIFYILAPIIIVYLSIILNQILQKKLPNFRLLLLGGR